MKKAVDNETGLYNLRPIVNKSQSKGLYKDSWYVLAFGHCFRFSVRQMAIDYALKNAEKHCKWAKRVNEKITKINQENKTEG